MKPSIAGLTASAVAASTILLAFQEGAKGNGQEQATGQITPAQIEAELKAMNVFNEVKKDTDGTDVYDLTVDGVSVQFHVRPSTTGTPQFWRLSAGWELTSKPRPDDVNKFNMSARQAFSYLDNLYDPYLVMDQNIASGSSVEMLRSTVQAYRESIPAFKSVVLRGRG